MEVDDERELAGESYNPEPFVSYRLLDYATPYDAIRDQTGDIKPFIPERLKDGRSYRNFIDEFLVEAVDQHLLEHFGKWCSVVLAKDSPEMMKNFLMCITRSESFVYKLAVQIYRMYPQDTTTDEAMKLIGQRYLTCPGIESFRRILVRALKYGFALYRDTLVEPAESAQESIAWDGYLREYAARLDTLVSTFDLENFVVEAMSEAFKEVSNFSITRHCSDLTDPDMYINAIDECNHLTNFMKMMNPAFDVLYSHGMVYFTKAYVYYMIENCYDLVVELYPATRENMKQFLKTMKTLRWFGRDKFLNKLIADIRLKLLKTGISTKHILVSYANVAECLAFFDESCVMMHKCCQVIKDYVVTRQDTIRTIIRYVTSERPGLYDNKKITNTAYVDSDLNNINDEYVLAIEETKSNSFEKWVPDPVDAEPSESRLARQSADVFSMLVSIYGTKDMFVKEYRNFLADRLVANGYKFNFKDECQYIEMMKKRFQEGELAQCEVMLDDMKASEKLCRNVSDVLDLRVISEEYWPEVNDIQGPELPMLKPIQDAFAKVFEITKYNTRKLHWYSTYGGSAQINMTFGSVDVNIWVSMLNFHFINLFVDHDELTMPEIEEKLKINRNLVQKTADWWADRGCIYRDNGVLRISQDEASWAKLVKEAEEKNNRLLPQLDEEPPEESAEDAEDEDKELVETMEEFWNYILSNIKMAAKKNNQGNPITSERLLSMFRLFGSPGRPQYQPKHVTMFMSKKVRAGLVYVENGVFKAAN